MYNRSGELLKKVAQEVLEKKKKDVKVFRNNFELMLVGSIISTVLDSNNNLVIYEVSNFENLFDYSDLFIRLRNAGEILVNNRKVRIAPITSFQSKIDVSDFIEMSLGDGAIPIVAYFLGDFLPSETRYYSAEMRELVGVLTSALFEKVCYVILFTTNQVVLYDNIPLARYGVVVEDVAPKLIAREYPDKRAYADVIGFSKVISMGHQELFEYTRKRKLPAPHTIKYLVKDAVFDEIVLTESLKEYIRLNVVSSLKRDFLSVPSILLLGPPGSGKTTLSYAIANAVGVPAYLVHVELMTSKWLGESERMANETMLMLNDRSPVVAVFRDVELLIGGTRRHASEESGVYERIRSIISSWIRSDRRRFLAVFTISDPRRVPDYVLQDATFGVYKLPILPPLSSNDRRRLLVMFLKKMCKESGLVFDPTKTSVSEALDTVSEETWAFTPRELMVLSRIAVQLAKDKGLREVTKDVVQVSKRYIDIDRVARVELMLETVKACKKVGIPETLSLEVYRFETEVEKLLAEAHAREAKKKALISMVKE